jgi:hypothetical protein
VRRPPPCLHISPSHRPKVQRRSEAYATQATSCTRQDAQTPRLYSQEAFGIEKAVIVATEPRLSGTCVIESWDDPAVREQGSCRMPGVSPHRS